MVLFSLGSSGKLRSSKKATIVNDVFFAESAQSRLRCPAARRISLSFSSSILRFFSSGVIVGLRADLTERRIDHRAMNVDQKSEADAVPLQVDALGLLHQREGAGAESGVDGAIQDGLKTLDLPADLGGIESCISLPAPGKPVRPPARTASTECSFPLPARLSIT